MRKIKPDMKILIRTDDMGNTYNYVDGVTAKPAYAMRLIVSRGMKPQRITTRKYEIDIIYVDPEKMKGKNTASFIEYNN